jgi:uridine kinase
VGTEHIALLEHDSYYNDIRDIPRSHDETINFDHPDSLETTLLIEHIHQLKRWRPVQVPIYDFTTYRRTGAFTHCQPQPIIWSKAFWSLPKRSCASCSTCVFCEYRRRYSLYHWLL